MIKNKDVSNEINSEEIRRHNTCCLTTILVNGLNPISNKFLYKQ